MITYKGKSLRKWSIEIDVPYARLYKMYRRHDDDMPTAIKAALAKKEVGNVGKRHLVNNEELTVVQICKKYGYKKDTLYARMNSNGGDMQAAVDKGLPTFNTRKPAKPKRTKPKKKDFIFSKENQAGNRLKFNHDDVVTLWLRRAFRNGTLQILCHKKLIEQKLSEAKSKVFSPLDCINERCQRGCFDGVYEGNKRVGGVMF